MIHARARIPPMARTGTPEDPWQLPTAPGTSSYTMHCRRFSKSSVWSSWSTIPAATECVRFSPDLPLASTPAPVA